ncbi:uncharacterized protein LOC143259709 [Megalopta genalis]|uniref:uncharacterized protein LOC143259709 n=1 Tax=Megalopta genalis TaxID=115081 RepID=UPI003FD10B5B
MRSPSVPVCFVYVLLSVLVLSLSTDAESLSNSTSTQVAAEEEDEESLGQLTLAEFKERYRRLIPYMTFYVAKNYVNGQAPLPQSTVKEYQSSALMNKDPQPFVKLNNAARRGNVHRLNDQSQDRKFVPSVQYNPRQLGNDNNYFAPVRYNAKVGQDDYPTPYEAYQRPKASYVDATPTPSQFARKDHRYYANVRPLRPYTTNGRDHSPRKQLTKPVLGNVRDDYALNYNVRPIVNGVHYLPKEYQGHRPQPSLLYSTGMSPESVPEKQALPAPQLIRNPSVNLDQIVESLHLSERLPEILNRDNIDNSLRTLAEILNILHNNKKEEAPQIQQVPLIPLAKAPPRLPQKIASAKVRPQTRPKVITETRFQVTPNPLYLTDDPERYKLTPYEEEDVNPLPPAEPPYLENNLNNQKLEPNFMRDHLSNHNTEPSYVGNGLNNKLLEYYIPVVQDISIKNQEEFLPTVRPQVHHQFPSDGSTENSYEITENLNEDVLQQDRYPPPLPATTESSDYSYTEPNKISTPKLSVPQTSVKYGATQGKAHIDYPAYSSIPLTNFSCKEQRYKGFFGDPETACQVWHYCDLNGGKSSFLCPNGTIFSQVALTCDWWFNVKCETTTQLYVLNERLYKYILPVMPKFPEDFTGPEVDRYLELKFKEMEAKLKENLKKEKEEKEKEKLKDKPETKKEEE